MSTVLIRPTLDCPSCGGLMLAKERLFFHSEGTRSIDSEYRANLADELTGVSFKCTQCPYEFGVTRVTAYTDNGHKLHY